ncbi:tetratricopeptide (TPR) repeat protein [Kibdelosporangium banguiense]|uniref:Tetratricopeptide (TPR) repeat protein n=1 Tax=Kibdelosporangium banguiense TaxID=1365924 RepID=A0ABS4TQB5_9PSEU|nr:tetratricopeptide repeat protein [Kibdelosporangium banguiense]MBP2326602.1 tetratricopeptide (TPR) repeat protein [Kibdelosporangium banguiense]
MSLHERVRHAHAEVQLARFTQLAEQSDTLGLAGPAQDDAARMWPQVEHALRWLASQSDENDTAAAQLSTVMRGATGMLTIESASLDQREDWTRAAIRAAQRLGRERDVCLLYGNLGTVLLDRDDFVPAVECFESALRLGSQSEPILRAQDFDGLATAYAALGWQSEAEKLFDAALTVFAETAHHRDEVATRLHRCRARLSWEEPGGALEDMQVLRRLIDEDGATFASSEVLRLQLEVWAHAGMARHALDHADRWVDAMREAGELSLAEVRLARASVNFILGRPDAAVPDLTAAQQIVQTNHADQMLYEVLTLLGASYRDTGRFDDSRSALLHRRDLAASAGTKRRWQAATDLAHSAAAAGDLATARTFHQQALDLVTADTATITTVGEKRFPDATYQIYDQRAKALSLSALADLDVRAQNSAEAWQGHDAAIDESWTSVRLCVRILDQAGRSAFAVEDYERVLTYQQRRAEILAELDDPRALAHAFGECADALRLLGRYAESISHYERVTELDREVANHHDEARSLCDIANVHAILGNADLSVEYYERAARLAACHDYRMIRVHALAGIAEVTTDPVITAASLLRAWLLATAIEYDGGIGHTSERLSALPDADLDLWRTHAIAEQELATTSSPEQAVEHLRSAVNFAAASRDQTALWDALDNLAGAAQTVGDVALAVETLLDAEALTVVADAPDIEDAVLDHVSLLVGRRLENTDAAISILRRRLDRATARGDTRARMRSLIRLAQLHVNTIDEDNAHAMLEEALHLARALGDPVGEVDVLGLSGAIERRHDLGDTPDTLVRAIFLAEQHCPEAVENLRLLAQ